MTQFCRSLLATFIAFSLALLTSCVNPMKTLHDADYQVTQNQQKILRTQTGSILPEAPVKNYSGYYVNPQPVSLQAQPAWMRRHIVVQAHNVPFSFVVSQILRDTDIAVDYQNGINQNQNVSIDYSGTVQGALNQLAADTNYAYSNDSDSLTWQAFVTKTFNIAFMPGTSSYQVGQNEGLGAGEAASVANTSGGTGSNTISTMSGDLGSQEYSNLKGNLSVWDDLKATLNELKSKDGTVYVSESTTTVTVNDHPANVKAISDYINQLNKNLSREVAIQVEVLQVQLDKEFNWGIDWNLIFNVLGSRLGLAANLGAAANISGAATQGAGVDNALAVFQIGNLEGSNALVNALSQQGRVSVVTQPRVVTMNNQMAEIRITRDTSYLQSVSNTTLANAGSANVTTSLTPGIVTDGFTLYLLPKIKDNRVYLQITSSLSTLTAINTVTNEPAGTEANSSSSSSSSNSTNNNNTGQFQQIQVPTLDNQTFNQRTVVTSGSTLVIAGFQQLRDQTQRNQLLGIQPLGGLGAERANTQTIVLITPTVLGKF